MKNFLRQNGILLLVIALLLSVLIGIVSLVMGGSADPLSNIVNTVTSPVRGGIAAAADWVESVYAYVFRYGELQDELNDLRTQVGRLQEEVRPGGGGRPGERTAPGAAGVPDPAAGADHRTGQGHRPVHLKLGVHPYPEQGDHL